MSITRKMLAAMGLEADKIDQIIDGHSETVSALNEQIDQAKEEARQEAESKRQKEEEYNNLKNEFEQYKSDVDRKAVRASKESAFREILKDAGVPEKYHAKIMKYSDIDGIELTDTGAAVNASDLLTEIKTEWADHIVKDDKHGASTPTPPASTGNRMTIEEIDAITDTAERQKAMLENHDLYGI